MIARVTYWESLRTYWGGDHSQASLRAWRRAMLVAAIAGGIIQLAAVLTALIWRNPLDFWPCIIAVVFGGAATTIGCWQARSR